MNFIIVNSLQNAVKVIKIKNTNYHDMEKKLSDTSHRPGLQMRPFLDFFSVIGEKRYGRVINALIIVLPKLNYFLYK